MSTIITRNSATSGSTPASLVQGELAINVTDGRLFYGSGSGSTVKEFGVTASYALNALTASYAVSASYEINYETSSSYADFAVSASHAITAITSSYPIAASSSTIYSVIPPALSSGKNNAILLGASAGTGTTTIYNSNFIGYGAGGSATNAYQSNFIGIYAGNEAIAADNSNFIGLFAGYKSVSASFSTLIGWQAGYTSDPLTSIGTNNIIIGTNITLPSKSRDSINLGGIIFATGSYSTIAGNPYSGSQYNIGRVGINKVTPNYTLDVSGSGNYSNGLTVTGSVIATSFTGSLLGTASYAIQALSSSYALTASYVNPLRQDVQITGSLNLSGSLNQLGNYIHTGSVYHTGSKFLDGVFVQTGSMSITGSTTQIGNNTLAGNTTLSGSIIISGSTTTPATPTIRIYGDMETNGVIKFNPVVKNIDTSISASYIYVSGSTNDLYFSQNGSGYNNVTRLRWLEGNLYTGLLHGGLITTQSSTVYQVSSGSGVIVNLNASIGADPFPTVQFLQWPNLSASITPLSASFDQSFISVDSTNNIYAQGTPYTDGQYNTLIPIGIVIHQNHSTINAFQTFPSVGYGWKQRSYDFIKAFGPLKISGYNLTPSGSSTGSLVLSGGTSWVDGRNYSIDPNNPSYIVEANGITTSKIFRYYQSGSDWVYNTNGGAGYATIDPANYALSGSLTPVGTNDWSIQRVFYFPNSATKAFYIYYGNTTYSNKDNAIAGILTEPFNEAPNTLANAIFVGYMILRYNANFTTAASYEFRPAGLFRGSGAGGAGGGGGATTPGGLNTQIQYNNSGVFGGVSTLTYDGTTLRATGSFSGSFVGTLTGTASYATQALSASYALNATTATTASYVLQAVSASFATLAQTANTASYVITAQTASYVLNAVSASFATSSSRAVSASFASTASYVNSLNQSVIITGSAAIGISSLGPSENTLTLGARDAASEGGQIGFNAPGGTYTSASFIDNWQNKARILKGNNTTSTGLIAQWDMHTTQMQLPGYTAASSFPGTATANLAVDSGGNVITVSTSGGTVFPYTGNAVITGSLTTTGIIYAQPNGGMYFQGGDDAALYDINISNHMGIYGVQDSTVASIKLGSGGGIISGKSNNIGIGTINPTSASLTVNGNVWATSFTGSLQGTATTASYVLNAVSSSFATTASYYGGSVISASYATTASYSNTSTSASFATTATTASYVLNAISSSFASTASFVQNAQTASYVLQAVSASFATTASYVLQAVSASYATQALSSSFALTATSASYALNATNATTASYVLNAVSASFATLAQTANTASYVVTAQTASYVLQAVSASFATSSSRAVSASFATTASYAIQALSASYAPDTTFPYNGDAQISGSLNLTGSFNVQTYDGVLANAYVPAISISDGGRSIFDIFGTGSIDAGGRILIDNAGFPSLGWSSRTMFDLSNQSSIDWQSRIAYDTSGTTYAIDWNNRLAIDAFGISSVDWGNRQLLDSTGNAAISWNPITQTQAVEINSYTRKILPLATVVESFSNLPVYASFNPDGEILNGVNLDASVANFDLVYLETDSKWYPVNVTTSSSSKLLGIAWGVGTGKEKVLIEGTMTVAIASSGATDAPLVDGINYGLPIYIRTGGGFYMATTPPGTSGNYVRVLGHAYYQGATATDYWVMKFRPANDWYVI